MDRTETQKLIAAECDAVKELLLLKNREYGNSALEPVGVFSHLDAVQQIEVRIDDKLKRLQTTRRMAAGEVEIHEDTEQDLIGYLILLRVARKARRAEAVEDYLAPEICECCEQSFENPVAFANHRQDAHDGSCPGLRAAGTCLHCQKHFESREALMDHLILDGPVRVCPDLVAP